MASITVNGKYDPTSGTIRVYRQDLYNASPADGLRRRLPDIELDPFIFSENMGLRPRKKLSFQQLRFLRMSMPAANSCIDFLKNRALSFPFKIVRTDGSKRHNNFSQKRADRVIKLLQGPNQFNHTYRMQLSMFLENLLERDLGTFEKEIYPAGGIRQWAVIESSKMRPNPKNFQGDLSLPSYFEFDSMMLETKVNEYRADELTWANLNPQAGGFYGFAPLEVLDMIILMSIYASQHNLKLVHPNSEKGGGIVYLGNVNTTVRKEFETRYAIFRQSDPARPMFTSGGDIAPQYLSLRDKTDMDYPELLYALAEVVASCFQLNVRDIGMSSNKGSAGTAEMDDLITQRSAIIPRMLILQDVFTVGIVRQAGGDDLALEYVTKKDETLDTRVRAGSMALGRGAITLNEYRDMIDETLERYPENYGDKPFIISGNNVLRVEDVLTGKVQPAEVIDINKNKDKTSEQIITDKFKRTTQKQTDRGVDQNWQ